MNDVGLGLHSKSIIMASNSTKENIFLSMYGLGILITLPPPQTKKKTHYFLLFFWFFFGFWWPYLAGITSASMWTRFSHSQIYVISKIVFCRFWNVPKGVDSSWPPFVQALLLLLLLRFVAVVSMAAASPSSRRCCGASLQIAISSTTFVRSNPLSLNAWSSIDWVHKGCIVQLLQLPFSSVFLWALLIDQEDGAGMVRVF